MDRNGKLPAKATVLAPMLQDVLSSMSDSHMDMIRSEAKQVLMLSHASDLAAPVPCVSLPLSNAEASGAVAAAQQGGQSLSAGEPVQQEDESAKPLALGLKSPQSVGNGSTSSFHSNSTNPLSSPATSNALFGAAPVANTGNTTASVFTKDLPAARAAQLGVTESDLMFSYRLFRHLIDAMLQMRDCVEVISSGIIRKWIGPLRLLAPLDHPMALYVCTLVSNLAGFPDSRVVLSSVAVELFDLILKIAKSFVLERRVIHLALMTLSNLALCDAVHPTPAQCELVVEFVMPSYTESQVVEAWCCTLCNITAAHPTLVREFTRLGVVEVLHRLLLFFGDDSRVVSRGLQCLSNLSCPSTD